MKPLTFNVSRITVNAVAAMLIAATVAACGKKTAPVPPEDVPPSKQERSKQ
jgi:predicted small lipoprotein YifL